MRANAQRQNSAPRPPTAFSAGWCAVSQSLCAHRAVGSFCRLFLLLSLLLLAVAVAHWTGLDWRTGLLGALASPRLAHATDTDDSAAANDIVPRHGWIGSCRTVAERQSCVATVKWMTWIQ